MLMHPSVPPAQTVTMTQVSIGSTTIAGEPELYLSSPHPEITSAIFTIPPGTKTRWMTHPVPGYIYVLQERSPCSLLTDPCNLSARARDSSRRAQNGIVGGTVDRSRCVSS